MTLKSPEKKPIEVRIKTEDGTVYAWAPEFGLTVKGSNKAEALSKMEKALKHLSSKAMQTA